MQAQLIDSIRALQYILILVNRDPDKKAPSPPDPYPIPDFSIRKQQKKEAPPGSFAYIAQSHVAQVRKQREEGGQCPEEQAEKK